VIDRFSLFVTYLPYWDKTPVSLFPYPFQSPRINHLYYTIALTSYPIGNCRGVSIMIMGSGGEKWCAAGVVRITK